MQNTTGKWVYLWHDHVKGCKVRPCSLSLRCEIVHGKSTWQRNVNKLLMISRFLANFHALTQDFDNKSENCNNKGGTNLLQSDKSEMLGPGWMIYWSGIWWNWGQTSTIGTTYSGYLIKIQVSTAFFFNIFGQVSGKYFHKTACPIGQVKKINLSEPAKTLSDALKFWVKYLTFVSDSAENEIKKSTTLRYDQNLFDLNHMSVVCEKLKKKLCKLTVKDEFFNVFIVTGHLRRDVMLPFTHALLNQVSMSSQEMSTSLFTNEKKITFFPFIYKSNLNYQARIKYYIVYNIISITLKEETRIFSTNFLY